jgi:poly-gamma-glutamate system protein
VVALIAVGAAAGAIAVETVRTEERQPFYEEKLAAAKLCKRAFEVVRDARVKNQLPISTDSDPAQSGLIGELMTPVTTSPGHLPSKQTSVNPNFAAVVVHLLRRAGVDQGDLVAVGMSGSFPAVDIAVGAAVTAIGAQPVIVSSASASQWGANHPSFMWPDIEKLLFDREVFRFRSHAYTRGGVDDRGLGLSKEGRQLLDDAITRNGFTNLGVKGYEEGVRGRMAIFEAEERAAGRDYKAYINVGGGTTSVGTRLGKQLFKPGLNWSLPPGTEEIDSVMTHMITKGAPVIHLLKVDQLAERYGLPLQPTEMPVAGTGKIFRREVRNLWLTIGVLTGIVVMLFALVRLDWGYRLFPGGGRERQSGQPQPMV